MNTTPPDFERESPASSPRTDARTASAAKSEAQDVVMVSTEGVARTRKSKEPETELEPLFRTEAATEFRARWDEVQRGFVDDPQRAVKAGDQLVTQVIQSLSESFATQRDELTRDLNDQERSTESLRVALRRYRAFFERLLAM